MLHHSIDVINEKPGLSGTHAERGRQSLGIAKGSTAYQPLTQVPSGGILARQVSMEDLDMVRIGGQSALSLNVRNERDAYGQNTSLPKPLISQTV